MPESFKMCLGVSSAFMRACCFFAQKTKLTTETQRHRKDLTRNFDSNLFLFESTFNKVIKNFESSVLTNDFAIFPLCLPVSVVKNSYEAY
jgi:hypothetical protein